MVTMSDVAAAAGVSVMTVSNVLNDRGRVGGETRERVLEKIRETGYEVDLTARRLRVGRTDTVALVVPHFDHAYFGDLAARLSDAFAGTGRHLVVEQSGASREGELAALSSARLRMYDGVVLSTVGLAFEDLDRISIPTPVVLLGEQEVPERFDHVTMSNVEGGRLATEHLLAAGARRVAIIGGEVGGGVPTMPSQRTRGWMAAHEQAGRSVDPSLVIGLPEHDAPGARDAVRRAVIEGGAPDAMFAVTDQVAIGAIAGLLDAGLRVPEDVRIVGFDDLALARHVCGGVSTISPGTQWITEKAVEILEARMRGEEFPTRHLMSPARLEIRATSQEPAVPRR